MWTKIRTSALAFLFAISFYGSALASQGSGCMPTTGTVSGLTLVTDINAAVAALISSNSGSSAPATDCSGLAILGQFWIDTSGSFPVVKMYDGTSWLPLGQLDTTNHLWVPVIGGGTNTVASASTADLCSVPQAYVTISGNVTITAFGSSCVVGQIKYLNFTGTPQITYNVSSLIVPGAANIAAAAGDQAVAAYLGSGNWRVVSYTPISGQAVVNPSIPIGTMVPFSGFNVPSGFALAYGQTFSRASFASFLAAVTSAQTGTRVSGSPIITSLSDTSQFYPGQKVEGTGIPSGDAILTVDSSTQITLTANATSSGSNTVTVFAYGNGDGSTTFTGPDCRGVVLAGRGNMGGSDRALLTSAYFVAPGTGLGAFGGSQSQTLTTAQMPAHTHSITDPGHTHAVTASTGTVPGVPGGGFSNVGAVATSTTTASATTGITATNSAGSGNPHPIVQPTLIVNCLVKTN